MTKNNELDQFFTKDETIQTCLSVMKKNNIDLNSFDRIIEPSAGSGNWLKYLPKFEAYDICPLSSNIIKIDYLKTEFNNHNQNILVIGNPPFGKNSSLAVKFFNHSAQYANLITFIVPRTFRKASIINRLDKNFHMIDEKIIDNYSYYEPNDPEKSISVSTTFQIWQKSDVTRQHHNDKILNLNWCQSYENPQFAIRRIGVYAGKIYEFNNQSPSSHFFIKSIPLDDHLWNKFYDYSFTNIMSRKFDVAGNPSITKFEFENQLNEFLNNYNL